MYLLTDNGCNAELFISIKAVGGMRGDSRMYFSGKQSQSLKVREKTK